MLPVLFLSCFFSADYKLHRVEMWSQSRETRSLSLRLHQRKTMQAVTALLFDLQKADWALVSTAVRNRKNMATVHINWVYLNLPQLIFNFIRLQEWQVPKTFLMWQCLDARVWVCMLGHLNNITHLNQQISCIYPPNHHQERAAVAKSKELVRMILVIIFLRCAIKLN